ncbi:MAG TPA: hypothetical protein VKU00_19490 [Chthonomonadaceae bacterium]|nr:hypothetical protein [Chthonomonadaceae bacterium]
MGNYKKMSFYEAERRIRAYHEAVHAVIGYKLGFKIKRIAFKQGGQHDGTIEFDIDSDLENVTNRHPKPKREEVERYMTMVAAGGIGNLIALPIDASLILNTCATGKSDREQLRHFASQTSAKPSDKKCRFEYIEHAKKRAWVLIQKPQIMYAVECLAEKMLTGCEILDGVEAEALIGKALSSMCPPVNTISNKIYDLYELGKWCAEDDEGKSGTSALQVYFQYKGIMLV